MKGALAERAADETGGLLEVGFSFLRSLTTEPVANGRHELGQGVYAMVERYESVLDKKKRFEAHRSYIDIHYILDGRERVDSTPVERLDVDDAFNNEKDVGFYQEPDDYESLYLSAGDYTIFYPRDAHKPGLCFEIDTAEVIRKVVVKVPVDK